MLDHSILITKLRAMKIHDHIISLLSSFLSNRQQIIFFNNNLSHATLVETGVPQGSILGPLLFSVFINDLPLCLKYSTCNLFADDCTIHTSDANIENLETSFQMDINNIIIWSNQNQMILNEKKN